ncbi:MAG: hypothetical protein WD266_09795 [Balneolales bacterium]
MPKPAPPILGVCFSGKRLLYALAKPGAEGEVIQVGCVDFSFHVLEAINHNTEMFRGVCNALENLKAGFDFREIRMLTLPEQECWTTLPKAVCDEQENCTAHLDILTYGQNVPSAEPVWFTVSNRDYKLVSLRKLPYLQCLDRLTETSPKVLYFSDFEIGNCWIKHSKSTGSFLTVSCHNNVISVSSFILGKLRAATYIKFDDINDLPYFWLQNSSQLSWLTGLYDEMLVYGYESYKIIDVLQPFWESNTEIQKMDNLDKMQVKAKEASYSFNLEEAFPAIMLAVSNDKEG